MTNRPHDGLNQRGQRKCRHRLIRISYISYIEKVQQAEIFHVSHVAVHRNQYHNPPVAPNSDCQAMKNVHQTHSDR